MEPDLSVIALWLQATGPYSLVAVLGWAFWRINNRKDAMLNALHERIVDMAEAQTTAVIKVEAALVALKEAISRAVQLSAATDPGEQSSV